MAQSQAAAEQIESPSANGDERTRELSKIAFPYLSLNEGIEIAKAVHELHGSTATTEQVAGHLQSTPTSSTFRTKVSTAKVFGLISGTQGNLTLTPLGTRICDPQQEEAARVDAFLEVELYSAVYDQFKGATLPPNAGLESALLTLGVAPKQKERARQILQKSAQEAGFFRFGKERLVKPAIKATASSTATPNEEGTPDTKKKKSKDEDEDDLHPFIKGLLKKLPQPETEWTSDGRAKWLQAAINIFDLMYTDSDDSRRSLAITMQKDSAR